MVCVCVGGGQFCAQSDGYFGGYYMHRDYIGIIRVQTTLRETGIMAGTDTRQNILPPTHTNMNQTTRHRVKGDGNTSLTVNVLHLLVK